MVTAADGARTMVDLFAGTGGASQAFAEAGWRVLRVDRSTAAGPTAAGPGVGAVVADVLQWPFVDDLDVDFLWSSPPCTEFSDANPRVDHATKRPSLELVGGDPGARRDAAAPVLDHGERPGRYPLPGRPGAEDRPVVPLGLLPTRRCHLPGSGPPKKGRGPHGPSPRRHPLGSLAGRPPDRRTLLVCALPARHAAFSAAPPFRSAVRRRQLGAEARPMKLPPPLNRSHPT